MLGLVEPKQPPLRVMTYPDTAVDVDVTNGDDEATGETPSNLVTNHGRREPPQPIVHMEKNYEVFPLPLERDDAAIGGEDTDVHVALLLHRLYVQKDLSTEGSRSVVTTIELFSEPPHEFGAFSRTKLVKHVVGHIRELDVLMLVVNGRLQESLNPVDLITVHPRMVAAG